MFNYIIIRLLYLTPIGYVLDSLNMLNNNYINGINLNLNGQSPIRAKATKAPKLITRFNWFLNGILLLFQAFYALTHYTNNSILGAYSILAIIFGSVCIISAVYSKVNWNINLTRRT